MKLALVLLICLVGLSCQQRFGYPAIYGSYPISFHPNLYQDGQPPYYYFSQFPVVYKTWNNILPALEIIYLCLIIPQVPEGPGDDPNEAHVVEARTKQSPANQQRFLFSSLISRATLSRFSTVTSTATVGVISTCIPSSLFVAGSSTVACRRRRSAAISADAADP